MMYNKNIIDTDQINILEKQCDTICELYPAGSIYIYLRVDNVNCLIQRIKQRNRNNEVNIDVDYLA